MYLFLGLVSTSPHQFLDTVILTFSVKIYMCRRYFFIDNVVNRDVAPVPYISPSGRGVSCGVICPSALEEVIEQEDIVLRESHLITASVMVTLFSFSKALPADLIAFSQFVRN